MQSQTAHEDPGRRRTGTLQPEPPWRDTGAMCANPVQRVRLSSVLLYSAPRRGRALLFFGRINKHFGLRAANAGVFLVAGQRCRATAYAEVVMQPTPE